MNLPQYVTEEEVQRVCRELGIRDWTMRLAATDTQGGIRHETRTTTG